MYHLTAEITLTHGGMVRVVPRKDWTIVQRMSLAEFAQLLLDIAQHVDISLMQKAKRGPGLSSDTENSLSKYATCLDSESVRGGPGLRAATP